MSPAGLRLRDLVALVAAPATAAGAFIAIRFAVAEVSPYSIAAMRTAVAATAFGILFLARRDWFGPTVRWRDVPHFFLLGLSGAVLYTVALSAGQETTSAGVASVIVSTFPIWVAILAVSFTGERLPRRGWAGLLLAFCGAVVVASVEPLTATGRSVVLGAALLFVAALSQATYIVAVKPIVRRYGALHAVAGTVWAAGLLILPAVWWVLPEPGSMTWRAPAAALFLGLVTTLCGASLWAYLVGRFGSARAASLFYTVPLFAVAMEWAVFGDALSARLVVGGALTLAGVALVRPVSPDPRQQRSRFERAAARSPDAGPEVPQPVTGPRAACPG